MRKTVKTEQVRRLYEISKQNYWGFAGKRYDINNGTAQIPKNNLDAAVEFGKIVALESLLPEATE